ncbi:MAG TPA: Amuc_1100 family pilus-like protein [Candidatus Udaeobacter sp.]|nr:Amuc_1100 family pilus-like protein [Candidatus Udaeobacter sp.]
MKWFQQNRAFATVLIAFAVSALLALALLYWRWSAWTEARQTFDQASAERNRLEQLDPFPNETNHRKLQAYVEKYSGALDNFKVALKSEVAAAPPLAPNEFQSRLRLAVLAAFDRARLNNVKLPDKFQLGFDEFARVMPNTSVTPLLGQELSQVQMLINILLDAKVDSVTALRRAPLAEEHGASPTPTPSPMRGRTGVAAKASTPSRTMIDRNLVDVSFRATPSAARKAINEIAASTSQFFVVRTLYVHNEKDKGPTRERTAGATPAATPPPSPEQQAGQPGAGPPLNFIVGNEHIEVSATIEMLTFTF